MPASHEREWKTRKARIDPKLDALGWRLVNGAVPLKGGFRTEEYPTRNGPADYALWLDGRVVGLIEAKKVTVGPQGVLTQAERYARGIEKSAFNFDGLRVPFLYSTNGEVVWFHDVRNPLNRSREVASIHTPDALREFLQRDAEAEVQKLLGMPNDGPRLRPYQRQANEATEKAIAERKRHLLLAMATGTGKTFTLVNQVYRLMRSGVAKRVLFLVDRRALAAQAVRAFAAFDTEQGRKFDKDYELYSSRFQQEDFGEEEKFDPKVLPTSYLTSPSPDHAFLYVCTIQRMAINVLGRRAVFGGEEDEETGDAEELDIPIHAFDVVIADECHRGYTAAEQSVWRSTLDHFDAVKIGLTATPAAHTTAYFKNLVFRYEYERAVREGYLVDYDVVNIHSDVRMNGVFLRAGEQVQQVDPETGAKQLDLLEDERQFDTADVERRVTAPDSNEKIIREIQKYTAEHERRYGRFPKTLVFAVNDQPHVSHADQVVRICREVFDRGDAFVQKITGRVDRPLQRIREFRNRPNPCIAVTVDLLTTGVDIPDLEFLVFLRPVKSRILFEQMLGRGTRKGEKLLEKTHFTVFDCFDGTLLEYFRKSTGITAEAPEKPSRSIREVIDAIWDNKDRDYNIGCLVKRLQRIDKEMSGEARELFSASIPDGDLASYARGLEEALRTRFVETMKLFRSSEFQALLMNYPRKEKFFYIAEQTEDTVASSWLIRDGKGREYKPQDYLAMFAEFIRANPSQIEAIQILLSRPRDWSSAALQELRKKLAASEGRFTEENLQRVHEATYHRALVDIISMVKHAANEQSPLLTAAERVEAAFARIVASHTFTTEQQKWLDRIRDHLRTNLSVDPQDFDEIPIFAREGGLAVVRRVFGARFETLLHELNEAIAA